MEVVLMNIRNKITRNNEENKATGELFKSIGKAVVKFSVLELYLDLLLCNALFKKPHEESPKGFMVISEMSFKQKIYLFKSLLLLGLKDKTQINKIKEFGKRLFEAEEKRNILLHSTWAIPQLNNPSIAGRLKITSKEGIKYQWETLTLKDLRGYINNFDNLVTDIKNKFYNKK